MRISDWSSDVCSSDLGYIASVFAASSVIGPVLGGLFAEHLGWPWIFWLNIPIGLAALAVSQKTLGRLKPKRLRHRIDYFGAVLIVAAVTCVLLEIGRASCRERVCQYV